MRGGRATRGRGRGRGEELRDLCSITRSAKGKEGIRAGEQSDSEDENLSNSMSVELQDDITNMEINPTQPIATDESKIRDELAEMKKQLKAVQEAIRQNATGSKEINDKAGQQIQVENSEDFPPLSNKLPATTNAISTPVVSWKDKVSKPSPPVGMPLKFVPPIIENGTQIVHIDANDVVDLVKMWERAIVVYVVGGNVSLDILKGFIRKHWSFVSMPTIHQHEEGYFVMRFNTDSECEDVIKGGPYFLNRAPMVVKKWNRNFDFKEEIMRIIPVWVRLPNLPLHCWGEDTLSRIVSAIGVPVYADECTTKQLKVSYARVLVAVDITQDFIKEIKVRDSVGREFVQKAIPEWKPFFCRKCNTIGHDCHGVQKPNQQQTTKNRSVEGKEGNEKQVWMPIEIAKAVQGVNSLAQLRQKLAEPQCNDAVLEDPSLTVNDENADRSKEEDCRQGLDSVHQNEQVLLPAAHPATVQEISHHTNSPNEPTVLEDDSEDSWTPVAPSKAARKDLKLHTSSPIKAGKQHLEKTATGTLGDRIAQEVGNTSGERKDHIRDGNPKIPSPQ
ncbi:unnamed protein product [Amaranthus hypochondriacus]